MLSKIFLDLLSFLSIVGIWPRFVEPKLLATTRLEKKTTHPDLDGFKILHFTDLHIHRFVSNSFLHKIVDRIKSENPDLILFTGDFLSYAEHDPRLEGFLSSLSAPYGCFCCLGNHDYASYVSRNPDGIYDVRDHKRLLKGILGLFSPPTTKKGVSERARNVPFHEKLNKTLANSGFHLLENETVQLQIGQARLNLTGVGEYSLGRFDPEKAFALYDQAHPGIVLAHNPDTFPTLKKFPAEQILSGHTHGEQIHLPFPLRRFSRHMTGLENIRYTRGHFEEEGKALYVSRGVGCHLPLRFCSIPEIVTLTMRCP